MVSTSAAKPKTEGAIATQHTLASIAIAAGVGLHLGQQTTVRLVPEKANTGRYFIRTDLPNAMPIPATVERVIQTQLSTELGAENDSATYTVRTVEHCLAALAALGIDNVRIEIDGPELPLLDGSAKEWVEAIAPAGIQAQSTERPVRPAITTPISVHSDDAFVTAYPSSELRFTYGIDFDLAAIGNQWFSWCAGSTLSAGADSFGAEIAPARTFGLAYQIDYLRSQGLIKGGSLENALVCGAEGWLNPPLRFENEPARHKMLDLIGDLSLLGTLPTAHYVAYKASHSLHVELARELAKELDSALNSISP